MMKRAFAVMLLVFMVFFAFAETADPFSCDCGMEVCACFLQEGDIGPAVEGVIVLLKERECLDQKHSRGVFDEEVTLAVKAFQRKTDLDETGTLDDATLTYLIFYGLDESLYMNDEVRIVCWVPTDGGTHVHADKTCSGMLAPRKIALKNALAMGIEECEHCLANKE